MKFAYLQLVNIGNDNNYYNDNNNSNVNYNSNANFKSDNNNRKIVMENDNYNLITRLVPFCF